MPIYYYIHDEQNSLNEVKTMKQTGLRGQRAKANPTIYDYEDMVDRMCSRFYLFTLLFFHIAVCVCPYARLCVCVCEVVKIFILHTLHKSI